MVWKGKFKTCWRKFSFSKKLYSQSVGIKKFKFFHEDKSKGKQLEINGGRRRGKFLFPINFKK